MSIFVPRALLAAAVMAAAALSASASSEFAHPAATPAEPVAGFPVTVHLTVFGCFLPAFASVPTASGVDLRYNDPGCQFEPFPQPMDVVIPALQPGAQTLRIVNVNDALHPEVQDETTIQVAPSSCAAGSLCLLDGHFQITATWSYAGHSGVASPVSLTRQSGALWFFDGDNYEVLVKVIDGCPVNDHFWIYAGGLTDVHVEMHVVDLASGREQVYTNALGAPFLPVRDTASFSCIAPAR